MSDVPLHPGLVHLPIGVAALLPLVLLVLALAIRLGRLPPGSWWLGVALVAVLVATTFAARQSGEAEEERVETAVPHAALEEHEDSGKALLIAAVVTLGLALGSAMTRRVGLRRRLMAAAIVAAAVDLALAVRTGHLGGRLVYVHGAAGAYASPPPSPGAAQGEPLVRD